MDCQMKNASKKLDEARKKAAQKKEEEDHEKNKKRKKMMEMAIGTNLLETGKLDGCQSPLNPSSEDETSSKKPRKVIQLTSMHS